MGPHEGLTQDGVITGQIAIVCFVSTFPFDRQLPITLCQFIGVVTSERVSVLGVPEIAPAGSALVQPMVDLGLKQDRGELS
jgi:hypothetical protein